MTSLRKTHILLNPLNNTLTDLPTPSNISAWWNFGSLLGLCLMMQILTGLFLAMHYSSDISTAYSSVVHICRDVNNGWIIRNLHANGASLAFVCIYLHMARGLYYGSYLYKETWIVGMMLFMLMMMTAFVGYVLPWGQMSLWGATVITNLLSAAPYMGEPLVQWLWGGFSVDSATLSRFFAFHFILPFIIAAVTMVHLICLHETGSNNPTGLNSNMDKIHFHPYFSYKDLWGFLIVISLLMMMIFYSPNLLGDPENFSTASAMITPQHIKPEWYFLFAYTILRSVPNKIGGVVALGFSMLVMLILPYLHTSKHRTSAFRPLSNIFTWLLLLDIIVLTWAGGLPAEPLLIIMGQIASLLYFSLFLIFFPTLGWLENKIFN